MPPADWSLYRALAAVLQDGSLTAAARTLGLSQPTLGRRIATLEAQLGYALFTRSPEGLTPTPAAEALRPEAEAMSAAADTLARAASGAISQAAGTVRVAASEVVAAEVLPPILAQLRCDHPGVVIELVVSNRVQDLLRREADIAVRMARPQQGPLLARKVAEVELGLFAHPGYLARHPAPRSAAELDAHALVGFDTPVAYTRTLAVDGQAIGRDRFGLRTDSDMAQLGAIRAGVGIGVCHVPLAGGLVRVLPQLFAPRIEVWLAMHADLRRTPRYQAVFKILAAGLADYRGLRHMGQIVGPPPGILISPVTSKPKLE